MPQIYNAKLGIQLTAFFKRTNATRTNFPPELKHRFFSISNSFVEVDYCELIIYVSIIFRDLCISEKYFVSENNNRK